MQKWENYEETARVVLERIKEHFGLVGVEGKQTIEGQLTEWEIDAKGIEAGSNGAVIIECRLTKKGQSQEDLAALAFRIEDSRSVGAIIVTPVPLQRGAAAIAAGKNIRHVVLDPSSTPGDFALRFLNHLFLGITGIASVEGFGRAVVQRGCRECGNAFAPAAEEALCPRCADI
jgi:hypothetical protein